MTGEFVDFIRSLAEASGEVIKRYYAKVNLTIEFKEDQSIVTQADREGEAVMRDMISKAYPHHGIIGEEFGSANTDSEFVWTLDPVDGTISFASGCPLFGTLIGLLRDGKPVLGAIHQPVLNQLCVGDNHEATLNGRRVQLRQTHDLSQAVLLTTDVENIARYQKKEGFDNLLGQTRMFRTWGDCYGYLLLASGGADIMLDPIMNPWDIIPLIPVIQGANGVITTWAGKDASHGSSCVAANKQLHPRVLELLNNMESRFHGH